MTPWTAASQASLSFTISWGLLKYMSIEWCYPTISSSATSFSFCLQSFPASGSFLMRWLSTSGGQIIGASPSAPFLQMNIQCWFQVTLSRFNWQSGLGEVSALFPRGLGLRETAPDSECGPVCGPECTPCLTGHSVVTVTAEPSIPLFPQ